MNAAERDIQRANTKAFIDADSISISLTPVTSSKTGTGGTKLVPGLPLGPQTMRLIPSTDVMPQVQTPDGVQLTPTYVLLGEHDSFMGRWWRFSFEGVDYQIVSPIRPAHTSQAVWKKADVALR